MTAPATAGHAEAAGDGAASPRSPGGVRLKRLREGQCGETLFLVPGLEGVLDELVPLADGCTGPQEIYAVAPPGDGPDQPPAQVEQMAQLVLAGIRGVQPAGPYRLGGYSFGGLVALEVARQLRASGDDVEALFLIDAVYDERYWPRGIWLRAMLRRTCWQLSRIVRMPAGQAAGELRRRAVRLARRVVRRTSSGAPDTLHGADGPAPLARVLTALGAYRPRHYGGTATLIVPSVDRHFGCDTARLWAGYADRIEVQRVDADHLAMVQEPASAAAVARIIDHRLATRRAGWPGLRPAPDFARPMIVTTMRWFSAARLAHTLAEAGFAVSACRPAGHPLRSVGSLTSDHRLRRMRPLPSLAKAIRAARPDIILADDERALALLRRLHARARSTDSQMAELIARSLGEPDGWPLTTSRAAFMTAARRTGVAAPDTEVVEDVDALRRWAAERQLPIVLKTDGSWGGRGVTIVRDSSGLDAAWQATSNPPGLPRALKRLVFNLEAGPLAAWAAGRHRVVNAQQFVAGRDAIATAACRHGEVAALVCLEVVAASEPRGPASVVRVIDHPGMAEATRRLVARLGLHGFCGFDFILTATGEAQVVELNPRITPTAHLLVENTYQCGQTIVLFPPEPAARRAVPPADATAPVVDVPVRAPELIRCGERIVARRHRPPARMARLLVRRLSVLLDRQHVR